jgi:vancomycin resistance protein YoaR
VPAEPAKPVSPATARSFPAPKAAAGAAPKAPQRPPPPPIFDLPDRDDVAADEPDGGATTAPMVLGGSAAEGHTTGSTPRIGPATAGGNGHGGGGHGGNGSGDADEEARGRHFGTGTGTRTGARTGWWPPPWRPLAIAAPIAVLVLLIGAWAVDTAALSGQVVRNVEVGGTPVGGLGEESLPSVMDKLSERVAARPVTIVAGDKRYETTAGDLGLTLDEEATAKAALDAGRGELFVTRPFRWLASFVSPRTVDLRYSVKQSQVEAKMFELQGADLTAAHPPTIQLADGAFVAVPGVPGRGVDTAGVIDELPASAEASAMGPIRVRTAMVPVLPDYTDADAQALADRANQITANGLTLTAGDHSAQVDAPTLRSWIGPTTADGSLDLAIYPDAVTAALQILFADLAADAKDARFDLQNGTPVVLPSSPGVTCCGPDSPDRVWQALNGGQGQAALDVTVVQPALTTEQAQALGVTQPVGGNNAWRSGAPTTAGPGFTTYYDPGQPRVTNIHRIADIVRGTLVLPGATFSMNDTVGQRTTAKGFVEAGAIREGEHVNEVGGGVSQFATTTFNAAYFAGLDITTYQAHSEYFSRYPRGREATMGFPAPNLKFVNNTPYGILIWTSYTDTSVTVTLYSSPYITAEQSAITESSSGACTVVQTTRTRHFPDGHTENDTFKATYRPGEGQSC